MPQSATVWALRECSLCIWRAGSRRTMYMISRKFVRITVIPHLPSSVWKPRHVVRAPQAFFIFVKHFHQTIHHDYTRKSKECRCTPLNTTDSRRNCDQKAATGCVLHCGLTDAIADVTDDRSGVSDLCSVEDSIAYQTTECSTSPCIGPDDGYLVAETCCPFWRLYGNKYILLCWRTFCILHLTRSCW
jgi:hypothetical protein